MMVDAGLNFKKDVSEILICLYNSLRSISNIDTCPDKTPKPLKPGQAQTQRTAPPHT